MTDAWQDALAAEQQAVFGYSVLGPRLGADQRERVLDFQAAHASLRDATSAALSTTGLTPVIERADYPDVYPPGDTIRSALVVAVRVEESCASAWRFLFALAPASLRASAQRGLTASAVRAARWRRDLEPAHPTTAFPGI